MKKEYIKPSTKVMEMKTVSVILAGSGTIQGANAFTDKDAFDAAEEGVFFEEYDNSNGESDNWDF